MYSKPDEVDSSTPIVVIRGFRTFRKQLRRKEVYHEGPPNWTVISECDRISALVAAVIAGLAIGRISSSAWRRATIATLHLVTAAVSASTARNTPAILMTVSLRGHARLSSVVPVATTCRAWSSHGRLLVRVTRHGTSRVWSALRRHGLRTAVLWEAISR